MIIAGADKFSNIIKPSNLERILSEGKNIALFADANSETCRNVIAEYSQAGDRLFLGKSLKDYLKGYGITINYIDLESLDEKQKEEITTARTIPLIGARQPLELPIIHFYDNGNLLTKKPLTGHTSAEDLVNKIRESYGLVVGERLE